MVKRKRSAPWVKFEFSGPLKQHVAKAIVNPRQPVRHHRVPRFYLAHWADEQHLIRRTVLDKKMTDLANPKNIGVGNNFYSISGTSSNDHENTVEHVYSHFENRAAPIFRDLRSRWVTDADDRDALHWFMAAQMTRGLKFRRILLERSNSALFKDLQLGDSRTVDLGDSFDMPIADQVAFAFRRMQTEYDYFERRHLVAFETAPVLVTSDEPVVPIDLDLGSHASSVSAEGAPIIVLPVRPDLLVVSFHPEFMRGLPPSTPLTLDETAEINRAILGFAYQEGYERPQGRQTLALPIPPLQSTRFEVTAAHPDGTRQLRITEPTRWVGVPGAPSRVLNRWWN